MAYGGTQRLYAASPLASASDRYLARHVRHLSRPAADGPAAAAPWRCFGGRPGARRMARDERCVLADAALLRAARLGGTAAADRGQPIFCDDRRLRPRSLAWPRWSVEGARRSIPGGFGRTAQPWIEWRSTKRP